MAVVERRARRVLVTRRAFPFLFEEALPAPWAGPAPLTQQVDGWGGVDRLARAVHPVSIVAEETVMRDDTYYERLSALDQTFLAFETRNAPMHVALTGIFEPGSLATQEGGVDIDRIRAHIAARLRFIPRYRQRVVTLPVLNDAIWIDDDAFDLGYHVRHTSLPRPGGERQLQRRCAEILERPLDRGRPLWELWIVEGLEGGRFAMVAKVHHCMVDGIAGIDLLAALLATEPSERVDPCEPWHPRPAPRQRDVLLDEVRRRGRGSLTVAQRIGDWVRAPRETSRAAGAGASAFVRLLGKLGGAPATPFNGPIGAHRRIDWFSVSLADVKAIRTGLGGTVNDVVLTTVAGAVGRFLARRRCYLGDAFRTVVPVSVRAVDERGATGNRVSVWLTTLPITERDPRRRLAAVSAATVALKEDQDAMGAELLAQAAEFTTGNVVNLIARLINGARRFNLIVTNVPGPPVPFFLLGARMVAAYPHLPLFENQGLGVALLSYAGTLSWGIGADWNQMPDLVDFMAMLEDSFAELRAAAGLAVGPPPTEPRLTVHRGGAVTPSAIAATAPDRAARRRVASAAGGPRREAPGPRRERGRSSR